MKFRKTTRGQLKRDNRQLLLRAVYTGLASSRAELAQETGLTKPTVSDLIGELIDEGFLVETGLGPSTDEGGKRPRLLKFVPDARHVIGVSVNADRILGVLADLDGRIRVEHYQDVSGFQGQRLVEVLGEVVNGLLAQLDAPLLCLGVGVPGIVDARAGLVRNAPHLGWQDLPLAEVLAAQYHVPAYIANSTELVAMAQFAFGETNGANNIVNILIEDSVGVGLVLDGAIYHGGGEIGQLRVSGQDGSHLETFLAWPYVRERAAALADRTVDRRFFAGLTYLHLRQAVADGDVEALAIQDDLADHLAQIFAWVIVLLRPDHISLAGAIADLGEPMLESVIFKTRQLVLPDLIDGMTFSLDNSSNLVAVGAIAQTLQKELGLV
jgi:predicted NBD/HSP70 family sugar kinase